MNKSVHDHSLVHQQYHSVGKAYHNAHNHHLACAFCEFNTCIAWVKASDDDCQYREYYIQTAYLGEGPAQFNCAICLQDKYGQEYQKYEFSLPGERNDFILLHLGILGKVFVSRKR